MNRQDKKHNMIRFWLDKACEDSSPYLPPARLDVSLTTACNTRCAYCWQQEKSGSSLTFDAIAGVIDAMCALKPPKLNLTGGEPTIWPDLERLLTYAKKAGINHILLCTNGYRMQDFEFAQELVNLGVNAINVSVDTFDPKKFKMLRGYDFSRFEKTLSNCVLLKKKYSQVNITLASVVSKAVTPEELFEVKNFCSANNFGYFMQTFDDTDYGEINKTFCLSEEEKEAYKQRFFWLEGRVGEMVRRDVNPFINTKSAFRCYKGITTFKLFSDGTASFCWNTKPIGNILQDSFINIWTSPQAKEVRKYIQGKKCNCSFDCDIYESLELYDYI